MAGWFLALVAFAYLGLLFAIAYWADGRAAGGRSVIATPYVYSLSLAVYATAWTFYGSVGRAASSGIGFLPVYLGPTVLFVLGWLVLRKIVRIAKENHITSLADFISARYGKSAALAGLVAFIALVGVIPYISLQLKAISTSFDVLRGAPPGSGGLLADTALYVALLLAAFTIVFGTRHLDAAERHEGMVAAIAFESLVKLLAFLAVGAFVTFGMYDGFADIFQRARHLPAAAAAYTIGGGARDIVRDWATLFSVALLAMLAIICLPRQFQVAVIENVDETHIAKATWLFPLYLLLFNVFVLPIAFGGLLYSQGQTLDPDTFVLTLPLAEGQQGLALLVFIGGLSAATGMVIVESIALSTMVCNDLVMPVLLRWRALRLAERRDLSRLVLAIRRLTILGCLLAGYAYYRLAGEAYALVAIGLISFAAVAQFAPALLGGIFWKGGTRRGALAGLSAGFLVWGYTLLLPAFARSGWLPASLLDAGPFGLALLKPLALFGLGGLDEIAHATLWSLLANVTAYAGVSALTTPSAIEEAQAALFVDALRHERTAPPEWRAHGSLPDLHALLARFLGPPRADAALTAYAAARGLPWPEAADAELVHHCEAMLAGVIGAASARVMIASVVREEPLHDSLTGLPNRALLSDRLQEALKRSKQDSEYGFAVLVLALDRHRVISDSLGRAAGEQLLIAAGRRLATPLRPADTLARLGGDEFAVLLAHARSDAEATHSAEALQHELAGAFHLDGQEAFTTASIGIVLSKPGYADPGELLRDAQIASHRASARGGACHEVFEAELRTRVVALLEMETALRRAVVHGEEFPVYYQPIVCLKSGQLAGFEALVRMRRPDGSLASPTEFIPLTEETGLIIKIGRWVLTEACRQMRAWQTRYPDHPPLQISVNLAGRQFAQSDLTAQVESTLRETGLDSCSLKLEVTETVLMEHAEIAAATLQQLRALGIRLLMDDFGTGYSSLSYLHRFPISTLKIDASFVRTMDVDRQNAEIIRTIVALAHTLDMDLIAEGVETPVQLARLRAMGVEYGQGYVFAPPLDEAAAETLIAGRPRWQAAGPRPPSPWSGGERDAPPSAAIRRG